MAVLCAAAECSVTAKKETKEVQSGGKLKAVSTNVGLPKKEKEGNQGDSEQGEIQACNGIERTKQGGYPNANGRPKCACLSGQFLT